MAGKLRMDARDVREVLQSQMPREGEDRSNKGDVFQSVLDAVTEMMAGEVAEKILRDGEPTSSGDDRRPARELAALICKTPLAIDRFILFCEQQARDLLAPYVPVVMSMQIVLRIHRTMTGEEFDGAIATVLATSVGDRTCAPEGEPKLEVLWTCRIVAENNHMHRFVSTSFVNQATYDIAIAHVRDTRPLPKKWSKNGQD